MTSPPEGLIRILVVLDFIEEHEEAVKYDLIRMGLRLRDLGTDRLSYGDLYTIIHHLPPTPDSALYRELNPDWRWTHEAQLLAALTDATRIGNWQRVRGKKRDYPKPIPRPGVDSGERTYGKGAIPIDEMAEWLGWES